MRPLLLAVLVLLGLPLACTAPEHPATLQASPFAEPAGTPAGRHSRPGRPHPRSPSPCVRPPAWPAPARWCARACRSPARSGSSTPRSLAVAGAGRQAGAGRVPDHGALERRRRTTPRRPSSGCWWPSRPRSPRQRQRHLHAWSPTARWPTRRRPRRCASAARAATWSPWTPAPPSSASAAGPARCSTRSRWPTARGWSAAARLTLRAGGRQRRPLRRRARSGSSTPGPLSAVVVVHGRLRPAGGRQRRRRLAPALRLHRRLAHRDGPPRRGLGGGSRLQRAASTTKDGEPNGVLVEQVRDTLTLELGGTPDRDGGRRLPAPAADAAVGRPAGQSACACASSCATAAPRRCASR